ncbi:MAG: XRE family transcriptional regulator [Sphingobacteriales bacterium]|nr:MAG: XRE family transcriptional regulator [Sphingobacteriales bacterium]
MQYMLFNPKTMNDAVVARIVRLHRQKDITQHAVAQALALSDSAYCRIEAGTTELTLNKLHMIAGALGEDVSVLLEPGQRVTKYPYD